jgi:GxxExxY protein
MIKMEPQITQISRIDKKDPLSYSIIGSAMEVHREIGPGFLEAVYQESLEIEFRSKAIPFVSQPPVNLFYKDIQLTKYYKPDFICYDSHVVEIKAEKCLTDVDEAQLINSLKATRFRVGLLINFG